MLKPFLEFVKQVFTLTKKTQQHETDVKQLQQELKETRQEINQLRQEFAGMTRLVERLVFEIQHDRETAQLERKNLLLEIDNRRLQAERALPPPQPNRSDEP